MNPIQAKDLKIWFRCIHIHTPRMYEKLYYSYESRVAPKQAQKWLERAGKED